MSSSDNANIPRGRVQSMSRLRLLQLRMAENLRREYFRHGGHDRVNTIWTTLFGFLLDELREREREMDRKYDKFWVDNDVYAYRLDPLIGGLKSFSTNNVPCDEEVQKLKDEIKKDIEELEEKIKERSGMLEAMSDQLKDLSIEREELLKTRDTPEFDLLKKWMDITCKKCIELENEIEEIRTRIKQKYSDVIEFLKIGHDIFSTPKEEDVQTGNRL